MPARPAGTSAAGSPRWARTSPSWSGRDGPPTWPSGACGSAGLDGAETTLEARTVTADAVDGTYDVVVLAVKAYALEQAMSDLAPAVGPETVIVPLLNGMRHLDALIGAFGEERVYGGVCMIHAALDDAGGVEQLTGMHRLVYGPLDGDDDGRLDAVAGALSGAEFDSTASGTIVQDMWEKWVFLAALGAATTLMRASIGDINAAPGGHRSPHASPRRRRGGDRGRASAAGRRGGVPARGVLDRADHLVAVPRPGPGRAGRGGRDRRGLRHPGGAERRGGAAAIGRVRRPVDLPGRTPGTALTGESGDVDSGPRKMTRSLRPKVIGAVRGRIALCSIWINPTLPAAGSICG